MTQYNKITKKFRRKDFNNRKKVLNVSLNEKMNHSKKKVKSSKFEKRQSKSNRGRKFILQ